MDSDWQRHKLAMTLTNGKDSLAKERDQEGMELKGVRDEMGMNSEWE